MRSIHTHTNAAFIVRSGDSGLNCTYCKVLRNTRIIVDATADLRLSLELNARSLSLSRHIVDMLYPYLVLYIVRFTWNRLKRRCITRIRSAYFSLIEKLDIKRSDQLIERRYRVNWEFFPDKRSDFLLTKQLFVDNTLHKHLHGFSLIKFKIINFITRVNYNYIRYYYI